MLISIPLLWIRSVWFRLFRWIIPPSSPSWTIFNTKLIYLSLFKDLFLHIRIPFREYFNSLKYSIAENLHIGVIQVVLFTTSILLIWWLFGLIFMLFFVNNGVIFLNHTNDLFKSLNLGSFPNNRGWRSLGGFLFRHLFYQSFGDVLISSDI